MALVAGMCAPPSNFPLSSSFYQSPSSRSKALYKGVHTRPSFMVRAARLPSAVESPKEDPKLPEAFFGFTRTAEIWNSRACMIGLIGTFFVELIMHKGILQFIGVEVGKGLDLPL